MRGSLAVFAVLVVLGVSGSAVAQTSEGATAIELADQGMLECVRPDPQRKTCRSIGSYERIREGLYNNTTLMAAGNGVTLEIYMPVWLFDGGFCGTMREQDVMAGIIRVRGREVAPQLASSGLQQTLRHFQPLLDQEACWRYERSGENFIARATITGVSRPDQDIEVRMISPSDGYRVVD